MDKRVKFDFEFHFTNGGSIKGEDFRLDIDQDTISDQALAGLVIAELRLLMVGKTRIANKVILQEPHKRTSTVPSAGGALIDLSHTIEDGLITYKGLPAPVICDFLSREESRKFYDHGTEFQIGKIEMVSNTGTYVDCPFHRYENGKDLSEVSLAKFAELDGIVIHSPFNERLAITEDVLHNYELRNRAVLIHTGWGDAYWNTDKYYEHHPHLTKGAAEFLRDCGVNLVGIDSYNIDDIEDKSRPVHTILLGAEILIVEHMCNLYLLPDDGFAFSAVPPKFKGVGTFPVRAMARLK